RNDFRITEAEASAGRLSRRNSEDSLRGLKSKLVEPDVGVDALLLGFIFFGELFQLRILRQRVVVFLLPPRFVRRRRIESVQPEMKALLDARRQGVLNRSRNCR